MLVLRDIDLLDDARDVGRDANRLGVDIGIIAWGTRVSIEIAPHPSFDERQKKVIASDYGMTKQRLVLKVREAVKW